MQKPWYPSQQSKQQIQPKVAIKGITDDDDLQLSTTIKGGDTAAGQQKAQQNQEDKTGGS